MTSLHSSRSNFDVLVGWAYTKTKNGDQGTVSKREAYESRYINDRVEIELDEFKDEISRKFKNNKTKNFTFPRKISEAQPQYGKKASAIEPSKTQKISKGDKNEKNHSQAVRDYIKQEDIVPKEMNSDSKLQNMSKYIKTSYKPFEYKDTKKHSKLKTKYFYPKKTQKMQMINIKNCENSVNIEYDEDKMLSMFESTFYSQGKPKKLNKQNSKEINEIPFEKTNHTSQITDMNRNSYESKLKECVRTQNQQTLNKLLISSCNSSVSRKQQKKADRSKNPNLSKSSNPFSSQDNGNNYNMQSEWIRNFVSESSVCKVKQAPMLWKVKCRSKRRKDFHSTTSG